MIDKTEKQLPETPDPDMIAAPQAKSEASEPPVTTKTATQDGDKESPTGVNVQAYIGRQLRAVYDDVAKQPIPERFLALMKQLEEQTAKR